MRYLGGKARVAKDIADIINSYNPKTYVEPFCGGCCVSNYVKADNRLLSDANPYLTTMWRALMAGWNPPDAVTREEWEWLKANKPENDPRVAFVGSGCSHSGKFFGAYAIDHSRYSNYAKSARNTLFKQRALLQGSIFKCMDYKEALAQEADVVYCDPPYAGTAGYKGVKFDYKNFWEAVRQKAKKSVVLVSEYEAPSDFKCIWQKEVLISMRVPRKMGTQDGKCSREVHRGKPLLTKMEKLWTK